MNTQKLKERERTQRHRPKTETNMKLLESLTRVKDMFPEIREIRLNDGNYREDITTRKTYAVIYLQQKEYDESGDYKYSTDHVVKVCAHRKVETVVEQGEHQGWNDNDEPVVYNYVLKELILFINEVITSVKIGVDILKNLHEKKMNTYEANERLKKEKEWLKNFEKSQVEEALKDLPEDEMLPDFKLLENTEEVDND